MKRVGHRQAAGKHAGRAEQVKRFALLEPSRKTFHHNLPESEMKDLIILSSPRMGTTHSVPRAQECQESGQWAGLASSRRRKSDLLRILRPFAVIFLLDPPRAGSIQED
jgi:hypothetical protein